MTLAPGLRAALARALGPPSVAVIRAYLTGQGVPVFESTVRLVQGLGALREHWRPRLGRAFRADRGITSRRR